MFIDSFDTVIRCNSWRTYGSKDQSGSKVNVVFLNGRSRKHVKDNFEPGCLNVVVEQTKTENNAWAVSEMKGPVCTFSDKMWNDLKPYYSKATTGFLAVCMALQKASSVTIVGMEGKGHLNAPQDRIYHGPGAEHKLYQQWVFEGRLHQDMCQMSEPTLPTRRYKKSMKTMKAMKRKRGSHPKCATSGCPSWAKVARVAVSARVIAKYKKKTALCFSCQSKLQRRLASR